MADERTAGRVTIKDVATRAGVGVGTVSRVLNDHPAVTPLTRERVQAAIDELQFHPSRAARALSSKRVGAIAVVVPFVTHPSAVERLRGVMAAMHETGVDVMLFNLDHADRRSGRLHRVLRRYLADGLLLVSMRPTPDEVEQAADRRIPLVVVDADTPGVPCIVVDDVAGGRLAAQHLLELGHRRLGYVGDEVDPRFGFTSSEQRRTGFASALAAAGLQLDAARVRLGQHSAETARELAVDLLGGADAPTGVFVHSDVQALGVLEAAEQLRLRVPEDVSVMGFDDLDLARMAGLTTVRQPLFESGRQGASWLLDAVRGEEHLPERVVLPLELVVRRTTGRAPERRQPARSRTRARGRAS